MNEAKMQLPRWQCHKQVLAVKIAAMEVAEDKSAKIATDDPAIPVFVSPPGWRERFKGSEDDLGYYVVYDDGYTSWSPTKAFEEGYTRL